MSNRRPIASSPGVRHRRARHTQEPAPISTLEPFARRVENLRHERRLSQRALAARANLSTNYYQNIAHAQANPTVLVLLRLASALEVSLGDLFDWAPGPPVDVRRAVPIDDLKRLAAVCEQLLEVVRRLTDLEPRSELRAGKRETRT